MAAKKEPGKTILNKTRSSSERWTHFVGKNGGELVNGKDRFTVSEFVASDHEMKSTVLGWMAEKGIDVPSAAPKGWDKVETSVETDGIDKIRTIIHQNPPGSQRDTLVAMEYGDLNRTTGSKSASRKLRKAVRELGFGRLAGLPAA